MGNGSTVGKRCTGCQNGGNWSSKKRSSWNCSYWSRSNRSGIGTGNCGCGWCTKGGSRFVGLNGSSESKSIGDIVNSSSSAINVSDSIRSLFVPSSISNFSSGVGSAKTIGYSVVKSIVTYSLKLRNKNSILDLCLIKPFS